MTERNLHLHLRYPTGDGRRKKTITPSQSKTAIDPCRSVRHISIALCTRRKKGATLSLRHITYARLRDEKRKEREGKHCLLRLVTPTPGCGIHRQTHRTTVVPLVSSESRRIPSLAFKNLPSRDSIWGFRQIGSVAACSKGGRVFSISFFSERKGVLQFQCSLLSFFPASVCHFLPPFFLPRAQKHDLEHYHHSECSTRGMN